MYAGNSSARNYCSSCLISHCHTEYTRCSGGRGPWAGFLIWELSLLTPGLAATEVMVAIQFCPKPQRLRQSCSAAFDIFLHSASIQVTPRNNVERLTDTENTRSAQPSRDREDWERQRQRTNRKNVHYPFRFTQLLSR